MRIPIVLLMFLICGCSASVAAGHQRGARVCIRESCAAVEIADDPAARSRGLMYRDRLIPGHGMLFVFEQPGMYAFWMKNMRFPLDLVWIGEDLRVADISENVPACGEGSCAGIQPRIPVRYVLEVAAGFVKEHGIHIGDTATIR